MIVYFKRKKETKTMNQIKENELEELMQYATKNSFSHVLTSLQYGMQLTINPEKAIEQTKKYIDDMAVEWREDCRGL